MPSDGTLLDGTFRMHAMDGSDIATTLRLGHLLRPHRHARDQLRGRSQGRRPEVCAALVSCGVSTGVGAAINVARVRPGDDVVVIGIGGVGVSALVGSVIAGAGRIIAVDLQESKRAVALEFGATQFVNAGTDDVLAAVKAATGGRGVDQVLLTADKIVAALYPLAVDCLGPRRRRRAGGDTGHVALTTSRCRPTPCCASSWPSPAASTAGWTPPRIRCGGSTCTGPAVSPSTAS